MAQWEVNFGKLSEYVKEHGNCNVPYHGKQRHLAKWVGRQKTRNLTKEQRKKLTDIGFDWRSQREKEDDAWNSVFQRLIDFKATQGHCEVPQNYAEDRELATWVANHRKRRKKSKVRQDREEMLNNLGFVWEKKKVKNKRSEKQQNAYDKKWKEMFQKLVRYKETYGTCDVPYNYQGEDSSLGPWVSTQRRVYNKKTYMYGQAKEMSQERVNLLKSVGFNFQPKMNQHHEGDGAEIIAKPLADNDGIRLDDGNRDKQSRSNESETPTSISTKDYDNHDEGVSYPTTTSVESQSESGDSDEDGEFFI